MAEFNVIRDGDHVEDAVFDVDPVVDTANPFGDFAVIKMDDSEGEKFDAYPRGTRVDVSIEDDDATTYERFTGYVVERRETEQSGADVLEVEAYSFDQFLRRNTVTNNQRGNTITEALADIIQTDTPVTFDPALVEVGDDQELTRTFRGEAVETVLRDLAFKSNNEDFGVNDDLEFFFRERETVHIDRGIDNTQWFNYDIPELGKEAINEVEVWYDDGDESVIVDDGTDKLDLQDSLGLPDPGTQRAELNRPLITEINDAEDEGRKFLEFKNATLSGTVTTFGLFDARPGDTIDIEIASRGIDDEFVIAAVEYRWGVDETILTIVEKRGDVDDILSELNESVQRVEMEGANRDAPKNRITTTDAGAIISVDVDADGNTPSDTRFVNDGRRAVRDTWTGDDPPDISTLVVGDDGSGLSRSNDSLRNQTNSALVSQLLPDTTSVVFLATFIQTGVREVGLETTDGRLITRVVFDDAVDIDGTVFVTLDVSNDGSVSRGVLTNDGQTAVRDVLADNTPALPNAYAYGDSGTAVAESDTTLGNELVEKDLDEILIQSASTQEEWESIVEPPIDEPVVVSDGELRSTEVAKVGNHDSFDLNDGEFNTVANVDFEDETARGIRDVLDDGTAEFMSRTVTFEYDVENPRLAARLFTEDAGDFTNSPPFDALVDGEIAERIGGGALGRSGWLTFIDPIEPKQAGDEIEIRFEILQDQWDANEDYDRLCIDVHALFDDDFSYNFDETLNEPGGRLDGPESHPELVEVALNTATTRRNVTEANFESTWNNTENEQYIELANDGETFTRINNAESGSVTFADAESSVDTNIGLSRFSDGEDRTPLLGNSGQAVSVWQLFANPDAVFSDDINATLARAIVPPSTLASGTTLREAGLKSGSTLLTRHELAEFSVLEGQRISSSETTRFIGNN